MAHAGLLAHSTEGAALCFLAYCQEGYRRTGRNEHPAVTLDYIAFGTSMAAWEAGDYAAVRATLAVSAGRLARAGAGFFACPDNTAHLALEAPGPDLPLPGLHIAEVVADQAAREGRQRVAVLGTKYLMDSPLYPRVLAARGIACALPATADRLTLNEIIFSELVNGVFTPSSRQEFLRVIGGLAAGGCDAVALACTEIPLLITAGAAPLPTLDSTRLLARAAYETAVGGRPLPSWRGGPPGRDGESAAGR
jgi:aspartate/glutamate racemase